ncbi:MAG: galactokinase, partial [Bacteroidota bacterium]|nr:galactokinase [Bacteroidota bacterium]
MIDSNSLQEEFYNIYGYNNKVPLLFFAPGRVNLIGEHTDYNGGYVFPSSLNFGTYLMVRETNDSFISFHSSNLNYTARVSINDLNVKHNNEWVNYPLGVIEQLIKRGLKPVGMELLYSGDIPNGAGLSSSASIEIVSAYAFNKLWQGQISMLEMIKLSQLAENEFVGMNCGIMDQFAVGMGASNSGLFLNCDTLEYKMIPLQLDDHKILISNTNKKRKLTDSKYNDRRAECEQAVADLSKNKNIKNLSSINLNEFNELKSLIRDPVILKRATHVISENQRVLEAVEAIQNGDLLIFGKLMNESHDSLRYDYEVTGMELDILVEEARKIPGVPGSR